MNKNEKDFFRHKKTVYIYSYGISNISNKDYRNCKIKKKLTKRKIEETMETQVLPSFKGYLYP